MNKPKKVEAGDEDIDIGDEMPTSMFPPVEIEKDKDVAGGRGSSSSSSSGSSSSDSSSHLRIRRSKGNTLVDPKNKKI